MIPNDGIVVKLGFFELSGSGTLGVLAVVTLVILLVGVRYLKPPAG